MDEAAVTGFLIPAPFGRPFEGTDSGAIKSIGSSPISMKSTRIFWKAALICSGEDSYLRFKRDI